MKRFLLAGALSLIGLAPSLVTGQVTSINSVGYVNVTVPPGFSMIANQLNTVDNSLTALLPAPPVGTQIFKWNGSGFTTASYAKNPFTQVTAWTQNLSLNPGEGAFILNPAVTNFVITFTGEVPVGAASDSTVPSGFAIVSSTVPQAGALSSALGFPIALGDQVFLWNSAQSKYDTYSYTKNPFTQVTAWTPSEPAPTVGQAFWSIKTASVSWTRNFSVAN